MKEHGFYRCAACREWFEASLVQERAVGPVCYRCIERVEWAVIEEREAVEVAVATPLDRIKRQAGDQQLPGLGDL